jgi:hypothetical protein
VAVVAQQTEDILEGHKLVFQSVVYARTSSTSTGTVET